MHDASVEVVILTWDHNFFHFLWQVTQMFKINSIVLDSDQLMDHGLVSPLVEQWRHRVFLSVADEQMSNWWVSRHSVDKLTLLSQLALCLLGNVLAEGTVSFIANDRVSTSGHKYTKKTINDSISSQLILVGPLIGRVQAQTQRAAYIQTEQILVDGLKVSKDFLNLIDNVMNVIFCKLLNLSSRNGVWKIYHIQSWLVEIL